MVRHKVSDTTVSYLLKALVPYTDANLKLVFRPAMFFRELERISKYKQRSLQNSFYMLKKRGLIEFNGGQPILTDKGLAQLQLYQPTLLKGAELMVVFDIPESERRKRYQLRILLRQLKFEQVQKSVWVTRYECRDYLKAEIRELDLHDFVRIFESRSLSV